MLQQDLQAEVFNPYTIESGYAHAAFSLCSVSKLIPNIEKFHQAVHDILLGNIIEYIDKCKNTEDFYAVNNFELLYGFSGTFRYLLDFVDADSKETVQKITELLVKRSREEILHGHIVPGYRYLPSAEKSMYMMDIAASTVINYGLAHGMIAPLLVLSMVSKQNTYAERLKETIQKLNKFYMQSAYFVNGMVNWPKIISIEQFVGMEEITKTPNRQSWCYGSIGILRALYMSSRYTHNKELEDFSLSELKKIAQLSTPQFDLISPIICHGYAGTVSIFHEMYKDTGDEVYLIEAKNQAKLCIEHFINADFSYFEPDYHKRVHLVSYLEGYSGILQTLMSFVLEDDCNHKKQILVL